MVQYLQFRILEFGMAIETIGSTLFPAMNAILVGDFPPMELMTPDGIKNQHSMNGTHEEKASHPREKSSFLWWNSPEKITMQSQ